MMHYSSMNKCVWGLVLGFFIQAVAASVPNCTHQCCWAIHIWKYMGKETTIDPNDRLGCCEKHGFYCSGDTIVKIHWSVQGHVDLSPYIGNLKDLRFIHIDRCSIATLRPEIGELKEMRTLSVANSELSSLPNEIGKLKKLKTLILLHNSLTQLPQEIGNLPELVALDLRGNRLETLPTQIGQLQKLETLLLGASHNHNRLRSLPSEIGQMKNLRYLDVTGNLLKDLPQGFGQLKNLETLTLSKNPVQSLTKEIGQLSSLKTLNLAHCLIRFKLPAEIGQLANLQVLGLYNNRFVEFPREMSNLTELRSLDLRYNELSVLMPEVCRIPNLEYLDLGHNFLTSLPPDIGQLKNLRRLGLEGGNKIVTFPPQIKDLSNLNVLNAKGQMLKSIPKEIAEMPALQRLNLESNQLEEIPAELASHKTLESINLASNQIKSIPQEFASTGVQYLRLEDNPLPCVNQTVRDGILLLGVNATDCVRYVMIRREKTIDDHWLHLGEVEVYSGGTNIARGKTVTASSVNGGENYALSHLTDSNPSNVAATKNDAVEWFKIDLGESFSVDEVVIYNRNGHQIRAQNIRIHLSVDGTTDLKVSDPISKEQAPKLKFTWKPQKGTSITADDNITAVDSFRYVMIRREKTLDGHWLSIAEVEVYSGGTNIAQGKTVTASSVWHEGYHAPSLLTDGNPSNLAMTHNGAVEWFKIDLGESFSVDEVVIYNRRDCCKERAENIRIHLSVDGTTYLNVSDRISKEQALNRKFIWKPQEGTSITAE